MPLKMGEGTIMSKIYLDFHFFKKIRTFIFQLNYQLYVDKSFCSCSRNNTLFKNRVL